MIDVEKKTEYRFSINLNPNDPMHKMAIHELNKQGRRKTQFIVNAIIYYLSDGRDSSRYSAQPDKEYIERICRSFMEEILKEKSTTASMKPIKNVDPLGDEKDESLDSDMVSEMMSNFRNT